MPWLMVLPFAGVAWWLLGFPPGWGWFYVPVIPSMPVTGGQLLVFGTVILGLYGGLIWYRNNL